MEDSFKGLLVSLTLIGLFSTGVLSFIVLFSQEQGVSYDSLRDNETYLSISEVNLNNSYYLTNIKNNSNTAFDEWDVTQGFMGTNTIKQGSKSGVEDYNTNIFTILTLIANKLFGANSPIVYAIGILSVLASSVIIYMIYKLVRQGT